MNASGEEFGPVLAIEDLPTAILHTIVYADLFDYPLRAEEIQRYLIGHAATLVSVEQELDQALHFGQTLGTVPPFYFLLGRQNLVEVRRQRTIYSEDLWRQALRFGRLVAATPYVRMVSITGALAMNNARTPQDDIDLMIVTDEGRVWLARGFVVLLARVAERFGLELCPNYVVDINHLELADRTLFTAHELAQQVPVFGLEVYRLLLRSNSWLVDYLPNSTTRDAREVALGAPLATCKRVLQSALVGKAGDGLERWEAGRKIPRLRRIAAERGGSATSYAPHLCKGHVGDHARSISRLYAEGLARQGLVPQ